MIFGVIWSFECRNEIPSISTLLECEIFVVRVVIFRFWVFFFLRILGPKLWNCGILTFGLTLVNFQDSDARIRFTWVSLHLDDDFRPMWGLGWLFFNGSRACFNLFRFELVCCGFYGCRVKETPNSFFDGSIEFGTSSTIDLHM